MLPPAGPVKLSTGTTDHTVAIGAGNDSLKSLVQSLNGLPGLKAWLLQTRQGLALVLKSLPGTAHALQPASVATILRVLQAALPPHGQPLVVSVD